MTAASALLDRAFQRDKESPFGYGKPLLREICVETGALA